MPYHLYKSNTRRQSWKSLTRNRIKSRKKAYVACDTSRFCRDSNPHSRGRFRVFELYAVRRRRCCAMRRRVQGTRPAGNERNASLTNATVERNPQGTPFPRRSAPPISRLPSALRALHYYIRALYSPQGSCRLWLPSPPRAGTALLLYRVCPSPRPPVWHYL